MNFSLESSIMGGGSDLCSQLYDKYQDKLLCGEMSPEIAKPYMGKLGLTLCKIISITDRILNHTILTASEITEEENQKCERELSNNYTFVNLLTNKLDEIEKKQVGISMII